MHILDSVDAASLRTDIPAFRAGDTLNVHVNIIEGSRSRVQVFKGFVLGRQGDAEGDLADREGLADAVALAAKDEALEDLDT